MSIATGMLVLSASLTLGCAFSPSPQTSVREPDPPQSETAEKPPPEDDQKTNRDQQADTRPRDEEDQLLYRMLAAPEYLWKGFTYPIKRASIFYEKVDLLDRALDLFLNDERTAGIYPAFALGGVISSGIGFSAFHNNVFGGGERARASYLFGVRGNQSADLAYTVPSLWGTPYQFETQLLGINFDQGRFFPAGNQAREEDLTQFSLSQLSWVAKVSRPVAGHLRASMLTRLYGARGRLSKQDGSDIPLSTPGINTTVAAVEVEPGLTYDSRDNPFDASRGTYFDAVFTFTEQVNRDQFRYFGYTIEAQHYIPIFRGGRTLLLRGLLAKQESIGDRAIPFYELNQLDLNNGMRGFDQGRWRDEGKLLFNVEYRYPIWERFGGSIFLDLGQVFNEYRDLNTRTFRYSAGTGFRFATTRAFTFRAHVAWSEDGILALIRGNLEFLRRRGTILGIL